MPQDAQPSRDDLVLLLLAPTGRDASLAASILTERAAVRVQSCVSAGELCEEIARGCGAVVLAEKPLGTAGARSNAP